MEELFKYLRIRVPVGTYLKDPESSDLGRSILREGLYLLSREGLEAFTFKKLAGVLETSESSIYRYFESKHKLLLYLISLYWGNTEYLLAVIEKSNLPAAEKVQRAIALLTAPPTRLEAFPYLNGAELDKLIIEEAFKTYLNRRVDEENKEGLFSGYKMACTKLAGLLSGLHPDYAYPRSLASHLMEAAIHQRFYGHHLPGLTDAAQPTQLNHFLMGLATQHLQITRNHG